MTNNNVIAFENRAQNQSMHDLLTETIRQGAQKMLAVAVEAEIAAFIEQHQETLESGKKDWLAMVFYRNETC